MRNWSGNWCFLVITSMLIVFAGAGFSLSGTLGNVTGGIGFSRNNEQGVKVRSWAEFEAHAVSDGSAKGWIKYHDADGLKFRVEVQCLTVVDNRAFFSGPIVSTNDPQFEGKWILVGVYDAGSPGSAGDLIWGEFYDRDPGCVQPPPGNPDPVESGNLVVH